jgi:uncharacterized protein (DUF362 family)
VAVDVLTEIAIDRPVDEVAAVPLVHALADDGDSKKRHDHCFDADVHSFIAAMAKRFPVDLAITVGHPAMIGTVPLGGHAVETGIAIASTDPVAADAVGARLLGFNAQAVRHLWEAGKLGLGETDVEKIDFPAMSMKEAIQAFTERAYGRRLTFEHA